MPTNKKQQTANHTPANEEVAQAMDLYATADATPQDSEHEQTTLFNLFRVNGQLVAQNPSNRFPGSGTQVWYSSMLEGIPFVFASEPVFTTRKGNYGDQKMCDVEVYLFDDAGHRMPYPIKASLTGGYILNSIRALFVDESDKTKVAARRKLVWTLLRDPQSDIVPSTGKRSLNLAVALPSDRPPSEEADSNPFDVDSNTEYTLVAFLADVKLIGYTSEQAMRALGVKSLANLNLKTAYAQLAALADWNAKAR